MTCTWLDCAEPVTQRVTQWTLTHEYQWTRGLCEWHGAEVAKACRARRLRHRVVEVGEKRVTAGREPGEGAK